MVCHIGRMVTSYTVEPNGNRFVVVEIRPDGSRVRIASHETEGQALVQAKKLFETAAAVAAANAKLGPHRGRP